MPKCLHCALSLSFNIPCPSHHYLAASHCILRGGKNGPAQPFGCGRRGLTVAPLQLSTPAEASASPAPIAPVCALVWAPAPRPSKITCESPKPNNQPPESNAASRPTCLYVEVPSSTLLRRAVLADCGCGNTHGCSQIGPLVEPLSCRAELLILGRRSSRERDTHQPGPKRGPVVSPVVRACLLNTPSCPPVRARACVCAATPVLLPRSCPFCLRCWLSLFARPFCSRQPGEWHLSTRSAVSNRPLRRSPPTGAFGRRRPNTVTGAGLAASTS